MAILLFDSRLNEPALDKYDGTSKTFFNSGIKRLVDNIEASRKEGKRGLEFIDKYPDSHKIFYSDLTFTDIKDLNITLFKEINHNERREDHGQHQMMK